MKPCTIILQRAKVTPYAYSLELPQGSQQNAALSQVDYASWKSISLLSALNHFSF